MQTFEQALRETSLLEDQLGRKIDPGIRNLVAALRMFNVRTIMSCEGHLDRGHPFPWVSVHNADAGLVIQLLSKQNRPRNSDGSENKNIWVIRPSHYLYLVPWNISLPLENLQQGAEEFANRLREISTS